ncbi:MAG: helicase C-terminal domain-containing protein [Anaerolineales bacterium]|nr:exonuclease domain-containing protein [Anaerolineales bacterium]MCS7248501.1 exonuclease domain-containing protein [Anaerolineales bacterium]MDW8162314.1 helicase C-terminal domain-containing protein [Anaerolineales bacterium]MDW8447960.1 helicase C-terminal domain-containing protein [Anaerolineales bacterium]
MDSLIALDIETTGSDIEKDRIIEVAAVRFNHRRIEAEWHSLVNPGKPIPPAITLLTGITDQMLVNAPSIKEVAQELNRFIGNGKIVGHSVNFDLAFLNRYGIAPHNPTIDTYEIASVLNPTASRYSLSAIAQHYGIPVQGKHRALEDARTTRALYLRLYEELLHLPIRLLAEIVHLTEGTDWGGFEAFHSALKMRTQELVSPQASKSPLSGPLFRRPIPIPQPLSPKESPTPLNPDEVAALLEQGGAFARYFPNYEYRPQQVAMLRAVCEAFSLGKHMLIEAGTGTGKSMAYLIPASLWAIQNNTRVVISTNTINLQDQLINKDIPDLIAALGLDLRAVVLKGRGNYLCLRRFENFYRRGPENADEARLLAKILIWLQSTETGDRAEINLNNPTEREIWASLSAEDEGCSMENCYQRTGGRCPFFRIRQASQGAHLLIVNHALLLSDIASGSRVLPDYDYLIIDEAHHLEEATTNALSSSITRSDIERLIRELGSVRSGMLHRIAEVLDKVLQPSAKPSLQALLEKTMDLSFRLEEYSRQFFTAIDRFFYDLREGREIGMYAHQERIVQSHRTQPSWQAIEASWEETEAVFGSLVEVLRSILTVIAENIENIVELDEDLYTDSSNLVRRFQEILDNLHSFVFKPEPNKIYWIEVKNNYGALSLHTAPLDIGSLMRKHIWNEKTTVVLTSATLTTGGEFDYLRNRLQAEDAEELQVGSPFDYETSTLLYIVNDIPEPSERSAYQKAVETAIIQTSIAACGRTLVLFTSYDQLRRTSQAISRALTQNDILLYEQGEGASPHSLLESFRSAERAVLLGTRSFWEGIDVPGEALSVLIITKLPFDVPSDPIISARAETFEDPFNQYTIPEAILKFRQGFGRLIRSKQDRGVVVILDRRIQSKRYGKLFIDSLPPCTTQVSSLANLPRAVQRWLNL